jgi:hypothetical protein
MRFTVARLRDWKRRRENAAAARIGAGTEYRPIADSEVRHGLTPGEQAALRALAEEFGCEVKTNVDVPAAGGWFNFHAAVVRGEDLVAIEVRDYKGGCFPYFQIEYLVNLGSKARFDRFRKFVLYVVVVSDGPPELDEAVDARLMELARDASCEVVIRMHRLNTLRAKYGL